MVSDVIRVNGELVWCNYKILFFYHWGVMCYVHWKFNVELPDVESKKRDIVIGGRGPVSVGSWTVDSYQ